MTPPSASPLGMMDRLFLYGIRSIVVVLALVALGVILMVYGYARGYLDYIASGAIIIVIGVTVGIAAMRTSYTMITKPYFAADAMAGKTGRAVEAIQARGKGVVHIEHEQWSAFAEDDIARGDWVVVTAVDSDKVTLRVRKHNP